MKPQRPYLLRALYDWIVDSGEVPYVLVDATVEGVQVPEQHVEDGKIVLNVSPDAVRDLEVCDTHVSCLSRFGGQPFTVYLPIASVAAIYCKGSGQGMAFQPEEFQAPQDPDAPSDGPSLRLV